MKPNKPTQVPTSTDTPLPEKLNLTLTPEQLFNLASFVETLIDMDRKQKQWIKELKTIAKGASK